jgi:hypothetical protein
MSCKPCRWRPCSGKWASIVGRLKVQDLVGFALRSCPLRFWSSRFWFCSMRAIWSRSLVTSARASRWSSDARWRAGEGLGAGMTIGWPPPAAATGDNGWVRINNGLSGFNRSCYVLTRKKKRVKREKIHGWGDLRVSHPAFDNLLPQKGRVRNLVGPCFNSSCKWQHSVPGRS